MALITGLYEQLTRLIATVAKTPGNILRTRTLTPLKDIEWRFALTLASAVIIAFILASKLLVPLITNYPGPVYALFCGLIFGAGILMLLGYTKRVTHTLGALTGFALGALVVFIPQTHTELAPAALLALGGAAGFVMLLPGVSGSYLLLVTGTYTDMLAAVAQPLAHIPILAVFALGVAIGIILAALSVQTLLKTRRNSTLTFLAGIMLGALITPLMTVSQSVTSTASMILPAALFIAGIILSRVLWRQERSPNT